jgi:hypothetical protein
MLLFLESGPQQGFRVINKTATPHPRSIVPNVQRHMAYFAPAVQLLHYYDVSHPFARPLPPLPSRIPIPNVFRPASFVNAPESLQTLSRVYTNQASPLTNSVYKPIAEVGYPREGTRQTRPSAASRNDVWVRGRSAPNRLY